MSYILDQERGASRESDRLDDQADIPGYGALEAIEGDWLEGEGPALDLGCGTAVLGAALSSGYGRSVIGLDANIARAELASERGLIGAVQGGADALPLASESLSLVTCRFLYEYLPDQDAVSREIRRVLVPGGRAVLVDLDGVLFGIEPAQTDPVLRVDLATLRRTLTVDCFAGRRLRGSLARAGFTDLEHRTRSMCFQGTSLRQEADNYARRFELAREGLTPLLGGAERFEDFVERYLRALEDPDTVLFQTLFVATGRAPDAN